MSLNGCTQLLSHISLAAKTNTELPFVFLVVEIKGSGGSLLVLIQCRPGGTYLNLVGTGKLGGDRTIL